MHHRRSIRLRGYDYTQEGAYFVTTTVNHLDIRFAKISDGILKLNPYGRLVASEWYALGRKFPHVVPDQHIVMPDHFHGILFLFPKEDKASVLANQQQLPKGTQPGSLSAMIQHFKSVTTRRINKNRRTPGERVWQRNFYERIIRNEKELNAIRDYIHDNPIRWQEKQDL